MFIFIFFFLYFRFDAYRQPIARYYPYVADFNSTENLKAVVCLNVDRSGFYRIALNAAEPVRFSLDLMTVLGSNPLPHSTVQMVFQPEELIIQECFYFIPTNVNVLCYINTSFVLFCITKPYFVFCWVYL